MDYEKEYNRVCNEYIPRVQELEDELEYVRTIKDSAEKTLKELEEENRKLKSERDNCLKEVKLCYNDIHSLEGQISDLEKENKNLKLTLEQMENTCKDYLNDRDTLREENRKLKEERDFFKEQAILWRKDWKVAYKEKRKLESDLGTVIDERDNAFKKIKQLEERLDNKEKVNKQLREELGKFVMGNEA